MSFSGRRTKVAKGVSDEPAATVLLESDHHARGELLISASLPTTRITVHALQAGGEESSKLYHVILKWWCSQYTTGLVSPACAKLVLNFFLLSILHALWWSMQLYLSVSHDSVVNKLVFEFEFVWSNPLPATESLTWVKERRKPSVSFFSYFTFLSNLPTNTRTIKPRLIVG